VHTLELVTELKKGVTSAKEGLIKVFFRHRESEDTGVPIKTGFQLLRESTMYEAFAPSYETDLGTIRVRVYLCEVGMVAEGRCH
jgi:hypothetical protein